MLPLPDIQKEYPDAKYLSVDRNGIKEFESIIIASQKTPQLFWYHEEYRINNNIHLIPEQIIRQVNDLAIPKFDRSYKNDSRLREEAKENILVCQITGLIESVPFSPEDSSAGNIVYFADMIVCEPINPQYDGLKIYVPQYHGGITQQKRMRYMVSMIVPVKITNLQESRIETKNSTKFTFHNGIKSNYVAVGDIDIAQFICNYGTAKLLLRNIENEKLQGKLIKAQNAIKNEQHEGVVTKIAYQGIFVLAETMETVYIPFSRLTYNQNSKIKKIKNIFNSVAMQDVVKFNIVGAKVGKNEIFTNTNISEKYVGETYTLIGDRLVNEIHPKRRMVKEIRDNKLEGKLFTAYLVVFDPTKSHIIELEGYPGATVKLKDNPNITPDLAYKEQPFSVIVKKTILTNDEIYNLTDEEIDELPLGDLRYTVICEYNALIHEDNKATLNSFFYKK